MILTAGQCCQDTKRQCIHEGLQVSILHSLPEKPVKFRVESWAAIFKAALAKSTHETKSAGPFLGFGLRGCLEQAYFVRKDPFIAVD